MNRDRSELNVYDIWPHAVVSNKHTAKNTVIIKEVSVINLQNGVIQHNIAYLSPRDSRLGILLGLGGLSPW